LTLHSQYFSNVLKSRSTSVIFTMFNILKGLHFYSGLTSIIVNILFVLTIGFTARYLLSKKKKVIYLLPLGLLILIYLLVFLDFMIEYRLGI
jgi:hypothetical protein